VDGGVCLCGGVIYEVRGPLDVIKNCHCWRDRKATGAPMIPAYWQPPPPCIGSREKPSRSSIVSPERQGFGRAFAGCAAAVCRPGCPTPRHSAFRRAVSTTTPELAPGITSSVGQRRRGSRSPTTCRSLRSILPQTSIGDNSVPWSEGRRPCGCRDRQSRTRVCSRLLTASAPLPLPAAAYARR